MTRNCLIVAPDFPYPPNHGGRVDIFHRLQSLLRLGYTVHLVSTYKEAPRKQDVARLRQSCAQLFTLSRDLNKLQLLSTTPYQIMTRKADLLETRMLQELAHQSYELMLVESHYCLSLARRLRDELRIERSYLRVHNNEVTYFKNLAASTSNPFAKAYYWTEACKFSRLEGDGETVESFDGLLHISFDEIEYYRSKFPGTRHDFLPAAVDLGNVTPYQAASQPTVLFVGSLFMPNNRAGLFWYLDHIHPQLRRDVPDCRLIVAGNTKGLNVASLSARLSSYGDVEFHDSPKELAPYYSQSAVFINPMLNGAGVKLKTVNALAAGMPIVSTRIGNEGTGLRDGRHIMISDDPRMFGEKIRTLLGDESMRRRIVEEGQQFLQEDYNQELRMHKILNDAPQLDAASQIRT